MKGLGLVVLLALVAVPVAAEVLAGRAYVVDGETLLVDDRMVALSGLFSPELDQQCFVGSLRWACGEAAKEALETQVEGKTIHCETPGSGDAARYRCTHRNVDIGAWLLEQGWALANDQASDDYRGRQSKAITAELGIWRDGFDPNQVWRDWAAGDVGEVDCSACTLRKQALKKKRVGQED